MIKKHFLKYSRFILLFLIVLNAAPLQAEDASPPPRSDTQRGKGAGYSTRDATVLSMMGWGVGLSLGIAVLCGILEQSTSTSH